MSPKNNTSEPVSPVASATQQWTESTVGAVADVTAALGHGAIDAGKQMYHKISENPVGEQTKQLAEAAVGYLAGAGQQAYQFATTSPVTAPAMRFTGAGIGSALTWNLMASSVASRAGRKLARAACIRSATWIFNSLHLPNSMRAAAVLTGVRAHNYIASGFIPGLFTAWAVYDGYRVARYCYDKYQDRNKEQPSQQSDLFEDDDRISLQGSSVLKSKL
ncbi:hypothetical protein RP20_CCG025120 [Aedes albopictus]|nr:hypothetical protein RP20_CCG025120 [Aedes albopictus]